MIVNDRFTALLAGIILGAAWCYVFLAWWSRQTEQEPDVGEWLDLDTEGPHQLSRDLAGEVADALNAMSHDDFGITVSGESGRGPFVITFTEPDPLRRFRGTYAWGWSWAAHVPPDALDPVVRYYPFSDRELRGVRDRLAERGLALKVATPGEGPWDRDIYTVTNRIQWIKPPGPGIPWDQPGADPLADVLGYPAVLKDNAHHA